MNLLISVAIAITVSALGINYSKKYYKRKRFYGDLLSFCNNLKLNINFFQKDLLSIFEDAKFTDPNLIALLDITKKTLRENGCIDLKDWEKECNLLSVLEKNQIKCFFEKFGRVDCSTEFENIKKFEEYINHKIDMCSKEYTSKGKLYFSLSIMGGIATFIILL